MIASDGSSAGTDGTSTSPAPSLPRADRPLLGRDPRDPGPLALPTLVTQEPPDPLPPGPLPLGPDPLPLSRVEPA